MQKSRKTVQSFNENISQYLCKISNTVNIWQERAVSIRPKVANIQARTYLKEARLSCTPLCEHINKLNKQPLNTRTIEILEIASCLTAEDTSTTDDKKKFHEQTDELAEKLAILSVIDLLDETNAIQKQRLIAVANISRKIKDDLNEFRKLDIDVPELDSKNESSNASPSVSDANPPVEITNKMRMNLFWRENKYLKERLVCCFPNCQNKIGAILLPGGKLSCQTCADTKNFGPDNKPIAAVANVYLG